MTEADYHDLEPGHLDRCQVCAERELILVIDLGHFAPCDSLLWPEDLDRPEVSYPLRLLRCPDCGLVQIDYVVPPEHLFFPEYPYRSGITATLSRNLQSTGPGIMSRYGIDSGLAIDIGSNDGTLLRGFQNAGMDVLGVEPTNIAEIANQNGIQTIQSFFTEELAGDIAEEYGQPEVVTAANMFAHVSRLGGLIRGVENLLKDDGLFVTESHYLVDLLDTVQYDSIYHEHLKYYSVRSIVRLFDSYDFTVVRVERIPNYGGSIRVFAKRGKHHEPDGSVAEFLEYEEELGLYDASIFDEFVERVRKSKFDLQRIILDARSKGERVVGIGCPGRAATLLKYCNIDPELMPYIAEQATSLKLDLYVPGVHIPIVDEEILFDEQPEYAVMLSWHYWEPIVSKLREKGLRSTIILPLPEVRLLEV